MVAAALASVIDEEAVAGYSAQKRLLLQRRQQAQNLERQADDRAREEQERLLPGSRARIENGLNAMTAAELKKHLEAASKTVEGLRALTTIFPVSAMPEPQQQHCVRCQTTYDPGYPSQRICRMIHPENFVEHARRHDSWDHCFRCDNDFNVPRWPGRNVWCFEGEHTQDIKRVENENWNADPGDLCY